jgi:SAM-dependent methyltransferase
MDPFQNRGNDDFYRSFEDRYRGSRELIKGRLDVYLPFVKPLLQAYTDAAAIDLGCGRGEWLEVLSAAGFKPIGVDLDQGMLRDCHELGLQVVQGDAIAYLSALPDESQIVVSAFHVVEHIAFDQLRTLVSQALRALKPGGLLIMETPNPENIVVATRSFYLDPTHQRPIPPELLSFIPDYYGFARVKILRLQESPELSGRENVSLSDVLSGASPDYAVVAQKPADERLTTLLDECFAKEYGLTLDSISSRYDTRIDERIAQAESRAQQSETRAQQAEARAQQAEARAQQAEARAQPAEARAQQEAIRADQAESRAQQAEERTKFAVRRAEQAEARAASAETALEATHKELHNVHQANQHHWQVAEARHQQIQALLNSTSWRVTAPLRWVSSVVRGLGLSTLKPREKVSLQQVAFFVTKHPRLKSVALSVLNRFPGLKSRMVRVITGTPTLPVQPQNVPSDVAHLTPRARRIYADLKAAIEQIREGK